MTCDILPSTVERFCLRPVESRYASALCFALLSVSCGLATSGIACATAFAVVAATMLPLGPAPLVVTGTRLVNQAIGFGVLHYRIDASTIAWGAVIGVAALVAPVRQ